MGNGNSRSSVTNNSVTICDEDGKNCERVMTACVDGNCTETRNPIEADGPPTTPTPTPTPTPIPTPTPTPTPPDEKKGLIILITLLVFLFLSILLFIYLKSKIKIPKQKK